MYRHISTRTEPLTRDLAKQVATMPACKYERPLKQSRVDFLNARLVNGHFYSPKWAMAKLGTTKFRVNGQHSSAMLSKANGEFPTGLPVIIEDFECDGENDLVELFMQFDCGESSRSSREANGVHKALHPEIGHIPLGVSTQIVGGVSQYLEEFGGRQRMDRDSRLRLVHQSIPFILWAAPYYGDTIRLQATLGAMYAPWLRSAVHATEFWNLVKSESHPDVDNATRVVARFLSKCSTSHRVHSEAWSSRAIYCKCIHGYNAYRRGLSTVLKYVEAAPLPPLA